MTSFLPVPRGFCLDLHPHFRCMIMHIDHHRIHHPIIRPKDALFQRSGETFGPSFWIPGDEEMSPKSKFIYTRHRILAWIHSTRVKM